MAPSKIYYYNYREQSSKKNVSPLWEIASIIYDIDVLPI